MKQKKKYFSFFLLVLPLLIGIPAILVYKSQHLEKLPEWNTVFAETNPVDAIVQFFGGEPSEVRSLRNAEVASSDPGHFEYYFSTLDPDEQRCYREILNGIRAREETFYITLSGDEEVNHVYQAVLFDHPEIYWVHNREHVYRTVYGDSEYCLFTPGYTYTDEEIAMIDLSIEKAWQEVEALTVTASTDYQKISAVYTYIIDNTDYVTSDDDQNIAGVFWKNQAVCAGYAGAVQYLLEKLGIFCIYVEGDTKDSDEGHAWNIIRLDGEYYYVDATNGDQPEFLSGEMASLEEHRTIIFDYLCPFPEEYELTYTADSDFEIPDCYSNAYNFYVLNNACFEVYDEQSILDLCRLRIDNNAAVIRFKFSSDEAYALAVENWVNGDSFGDAAQYYMKVHALDRVEYYSGMLESFKTLYYIF